MNGAGPALLGALLLAQLAPLAAEPTSEHPTTVIRELDRLAERTLWPGFDPTAYPVAIFTGEETWLFRHPSPPEGFAESSDHGGAWIHRGRHPQMRSNSKAPIGGVTTATLLLTIRPGRPAREEASILVHETFHVFQDERYPDWTANEAHRFTYPVGDADNYRMTIEEDHALGHALRSRDATIAAGWASRAMATRAARVSALAQEHRQFETGLETMEGTAFYVAHLALGEADSTELLLDILPPEKFRWRPYATGGALGALLDRFDPGWKAKLDRDPKLTLEVLLRRALERADVEPANLSPEESAAIREQATSAIEQLHAERAAHRRTFAEAPSSLTVTLASESEAFEMEVFDPVNVLHLGDGEVLHGHKLVLTGAAGRIEMTNPGFVRRQFVGLNALTAVGSGHPLFGDVTRVTFVGFAKPPRVNQQDQGVEIVTDGLRVELTAATVDRDGDRITVRAR